MQYYFIIITSHCQHGSPCPSLLGGLPGDILYRHRAVILFTNPSARAGYDTRSIFKRSLTGLNSELYIGSSWSSYLCSFMWRGPPEYVAYELVLTSPAVSYMSSSFNLDSVCDGWLVAIKLLFCRVLPPGLGTAKTTLTLSACINDIITKMTANMKQ